MENRIVGGNCLHDECFGFNNNCIVLPTYTLSQEIERPVIRLHKYDRLRKHVLPT